MLHNAWIQMTRGWDLYRFGQLTLGIAVLVYYTRTGETPSLGFGLGITAMALADVRCLLGVCPPHYREPAPLDKSVEEIEVEL